MPDVTGPPSRSNTSRRAAILESSDRSAWISASREFSGVTVAAALVCAEAEGAVMTKISEKITRVWASLDTDISRLGSA